jgi:hypothetical protein
MSNNDKAFSAEIGPLMWKMLYVIAINFPDKATEATKKAYWTFFSSLGMVLPRKSWRDNWSAIAKTVFTPKNYELIGGSKDWVHAVFIMQGALRKILNQPMNPGVTTDTKYEEYRVKRAGVHEARESGAPVYELQFDTVEQFDNYIESSSKFDMNRYIIVLLPSRPMSMTGVRQTHVKKISHAKKNGLKELTLGKTDKVQQVIVAYPGKYVKTPGVSHPYSFQNGLWQIAHMYSKLYRSHGFGGLWEERDVFLVFRGGRFHTEYKDQSDLAGLISNRH